MSSTLTYLALAYATIGPSVLFGAVLAGLFVASLIQEPHR